MGAQLKVNSNLLLQLDSQTANDVKSNYMANTESFSEYSQLLKPAFEKLKWEEGSEVESEDPLLASSKWTDKLSASLDEYV